VLERHGRSLDEDAPDDEAADLLAREQPVLASCYGASTADRQLLGVAPGQQTRKLAHAVREVAKPNVALAEVGGVNVHAGAAVPSRDRQRLASATKLRRATTDAIHGGGRQHRGGG
jgi:hypothetical protein